MRSPLCLVPLLALCATPDLLPQECTSPSLVGWWAGEEDAADGAGESNGTLVGGSFQTGQVGSAFELDGAAYVEIEAAAALRLSAASASTLDAWVYPTSLPANTHVPIGPGLPYYYGMLYNTSDRVLRANVNDGSKWFYADARFTLPLNAWTHVVQTWDGSTLRLYANGQLVGSGSRPGDSYPRLDLPAYIGRWLVTEGNPQDFRFTGKVDEVRVFSAALDAADVEASYLAGLEGRCPGPPAPPFSVEIRPATPRCVDLVIRNDAPINGGEVGLIHDAAVATIAAVEPGKDWHGGGEIHFRADPVNNCGSESGLAAGFTIGWVNAISTGLLTPPGEHALLRVCFTPAPGAGVGTCSPLRFVQCLGVPEAPIRNIVTAGESGSKPLSTTDGEYCVQPDVPFRRGDANADDNFDISDPISILGCLFLGTACSPCQDAADANDDGLVNISDPTYLLSWRFLSGAQPPAPFASCGADITADQIDDCEEFAACP